MAVRRLNHAVLYVRDLAASVEFYREAFGFEVRMEIPGQAAFLRAQGTANDHDLGLFAVPDGTPQQGRYIGLYHLAWEVGTLAELAEVRAKLDRLGALVGAHRRMREAEGALRIVRPPDLVARAFELTGLDEVLDLRDDREHELAAR